MRLSLFSRLTIGYLAIFLIVALASAYAVLQLRYFRDLTQSILKVDNRILDYEKALADLLLAQSRAEQKFAITRDEAWYLQFVRLKIEFEGRLESAFAVEDPMATPVLKRIARDFGSYDEIVNEEARLVRAKTPYPQEEYKQKKDSLIDSMLASFEKLRLNQQQLTYAKVSDLAAVADQAAHAEQGEVVADGRLRLRQQLAEGGDVHLAVEGQRHQDLQSRLVGQQLEDVGPAGDGLVGDTPARRFGLGSRLGLQHGILQAGECPA